MEFIVNSKMYQQDYNNLVQEKKQVIFNELCHYILTLSSPSDGENYLKNNSINKYLLCQDKFAVQEIIERHK